MNEVEFRNWKMQNGCKKKLSSDTISRLKRIEKELRCDIDIEFKKDKCQYLISLFLAMGRNEEMKKYGDVNLPIGKYYMATYTSAIRNYVEFLEDFNKTPKV